MFSVFGVCALAAANADIDNNGAINATDARNILRAAVGLDKISSAQTLAADVDMDGAVTASDARLALRVAVKLEKTDGKLYNNEFEIFKSGFFYLDMDVVEGGSRQNVKMALTDKSTYLSMALDDSMGFGNELGIEGLGDMNLSFLINETDTYIIDEKNGTYAPMEAMFKLMGDEISFDEMMDSFSELEIGSDNGLAGATSVTTETVKDIKCTKYTFASSDGSAVNVYMNGKKLVAMNSVNSKGAEETRYEINSVTLTVPASYTAPASNLKEVDPLELLASMMFPGGGLF